MLAACGGDDSDSDDAESRESGGGDLREVTLMTPFPGAVPYYPLYVAEELGYFAEEGLDVTVQPGDGVGAVVQQVAGGNVDVGFGNPATQVDAVLNGSDLVAVYVLTHRTPYQLVTLADSGVTDIADLDGESIGVSSIVGGEYLLLQGLLAEEGVSADIVDVGMGGPAGPSLEDGRISAYMASYPNIVALRGAGFDLDELNLGRIDSFQDSALLATPGFVSAEPEVLEGLGRAISKGTVFGLENPGAVLDIIEQSQPEEVADRAAARANLDATSAIRVLPDTAEGQWGYNIPEAWTEFLDFLLDHGVIDQEVDVADLYTNDLVEGFNDFDEEAVRESARSYGGG